MRRELLWLAALVGALVGVRAASMVVVFEPGYTDAYYYAGVAERLASGQGLTADFVWNYLEAPGFAGLPVASHRFWMPLATVVQATGIALLGGVLGPFRGAQIASLLFAAAIPIVAYAAARSLGGSPRAALLAGAAAGLGGAFAPAWASLDSFPIAAVVGTGFFLAFERAAKGSVRAGAASGALVGLLYLSRAEGALFGLALLWLASRRATRTAGAVGSAVALVLGIAWLARDATLGSTDDVAARALLLVRYQDFFALHPPTLESFLAAPLDVLGARAAALLTNALTAAIALLLAPLVPLAVAARARWDRSEVRAFVVLALLVYLAQSLAFAPHSVRGSFFHSSAAFFPYAMALAALGTEALFARATPAMARTVAAAGVLAFGVVSIFSLGQWDVDFNGPFRDRAAAIELLPPGPVLAADAAAWHWISGREALLAPADGPAAALCAARSYGAAALILEAGHFSAYDALYASGRSDEFVLHGERGSIRIFVTRPGAQCVLAQAAFEPSAGR